jgi:hypothetical protein
MPKYKSRGLPTTGQLKKHISNAVSSVLTAISDLEILVDQNAVDPDDANMLYEYLDEAAGNLMSISKGVIPTVAEWDEEDYPQYGTGSVPRQSIIEKIKAIDPNVEIYDYGDGEYYLSYYTADLERLPHYFDDGKFVVYEESRAHQPRMEGDVEDMDQSWQYRLRQEIEHDLERGRSEAQIYRFLSKQPEWQELRAASLKAFIRQLAREY